MAQRVAAAREASRGHAGTGAARRVLFSRRRPCGACPSARRPRSAACLPPCLGRERWRRIGESLHAAVVIMPYPQTAVPTRAPIPAVNAIASVPQNVTRNVALGTFAPPARAPIAPSSPRNTSDAIDTTGTSRDGGETRTNESGNTAPLRRYPPTSGPPGQDGRSSPPRCRAHPAHGRRARPSPSIDRRPVARGSVRRRRLT